ncbi:hypothetical protein H4219_003459 [Mycoemilia scoparia]|uniref:2-oxo-4-hydroxy-4-carboxy-5-ureidoimidazoline decarboxylase n=1 Tax=Mycoemilia scoparia TaxID=417184 RepID=A0A9W8A439_9FUNG|nr:hypothetical protein H4219_003459 [Mycoemilia scoparia]
MASNITLPSLAQLNQSTIEEFNKVVSLLFEPTPLLTKRMHDARPYTSYDAMLDKAKTFIDEMSSEEKLEVVNSHPRIGESAAKLSALSRQEQSGPSGATPAAQKEEDEALAQWKIWNAKYEEKHGFRFVVFVNGRSKSSLLPVIQERVNSSTEKELDIGLSEMVLIAKDRARKLLQQNSHSGKSDGNVLEAFEKTLTELIEKRPQVFKSVIPAPLFWTNASNNSARSPSVPKDRLLRDDEFDDLDGSIGEGVGKDQLFRKGDDYFNPDILVFPPDYMNHKSVNDYESDAGIPEYSSIETETSNSTEIRIWDKIQLLLGSLSKCHDSSDLYRFVDQKIFSKDIVDNINSKDARAALHEEVLTASIKLARELGHIGLTYHIYRRLRYDLELPQQLMALTSDVYLELIKSAWQLGKDILMVETFLFDMISSGVLAKQSIRSVLNQIICDLRVYHRIYDWAQAIELLEKKLDFEE